MRALSKLHGEGKGCPSWRLPLPLFLVSIAAFSVSSNFRICKTVPDWTIAALAWPRQTRSSFHTDNVYARFRP